MRQNPQALEIYRHFKGKYYQIITMAMHTETREEMVIYRPLYDDGGVYARPLAMFMSETDHEKYPEVKQKYRFERVNFDELQSSENGINGSEAGQAESEQHRRNVNMEENRRPGQTEENAPRRNEYGGGRSAEVRPKREQKEYTVMDFLDADTYEHKLEILRLLRNQVDDSMINTIAVSLDLEPKGSSIDEKYEDIKYCLMTLEKYECNRLR